MCIYPHQGIASFHPTSKDGLCGAHGRGDGSMHLCHIYCEIIQQIHGDDKSNMLIKIVHMCGWWKMEYSFYESLSPLFGQHEDMAIYIFFFFFSWTLMCPFFLGHAFWPCHLSFLIGHASFEDTRERDH